MDIRVRAFGLPEKITGYGLCCNSMYESDAFFVKYYIKRDHLTMGYFTVNEHVDSKIYNHGNNNKRVIRRTLAEEKGKVIIIIAILIINTQYPCFFILEQGIISQV